MDSVIPSPFISTPTTGMRRPGSSKNNSDPSIDKSKISSGGRAQSCEKDIADDDSAGISKCSVSSASEKYNKSTAKVQCGGPHIRRNIGLLSFPYDCGGLCGPRPSCSNVENDEKNWLVFWPIDKRELFMDKLILEQELFNLQKKGKLKGSEGGSLPPPPGRRFVQNEQKRVSVGCKGCGEVVDHVADLKENRNRGSSAVAMKNRHKEIKTREKETEHRIIVKQKKSPVSIPELKTHSRAFRANPKMEMQCMNFGSLSINPKVGADVQEKGQGAAVAKSIQKKNKQASSLTEREKTKQSERARKHEKSNSEIFGTAGSKHSAARRVTAEEILTAKSSADFSFDQAIGVPFRWEVIPGKCRASCAALSDERIESHPPQHQKPSPSPSPSPDQAFKTGKSRRHY